MGCTTRGFNRSLVANHSCTGNLQHNLLLSTYDQWWVVQPGVSTDLWWLIFYVLPVAFEGQQTTHYLHWWLTFRLSEQWSSSDSTWINHLTRKMTTTQVVKTSFTNNSLSEDYSHLDNHIRQTTDTPGFKPFTNSLSEDYSHLNDHTRQTTDTPGFKPFTKLLGIFSTYRYWICQTTTLTKCLQSTMVSRVFNPLWILF